MAAVATGISDQFTYITSEEFTGGFWGPVVNSNSFAVSVLLHTEQNSGTSLDIHQTSLTAPGQHTWLGTSGADVMNMGSPHAQAAGIVALYGGDGADTLTADGVSTNATIVAGSDDDVDDLLGGSGSDTIVGYYNQADISHSDMFQGGAGDDTFLVIDWSFVPDGGIPDIKFGGFADGENFTHNGSLGIGGTLAGEPPRVYRRVKLSKGGPYDTEKTYPELHG